jgi:hypothetical protein
VLGHIPAAGMFRNALRLVFFFPMGLGFELKAFALAKQAFYCLRYTVCFDLVILEMGRRSRELFAWAGLEPHSS